MVKNVVMVVVMIGMTVVVVVISGGAGRAGGVLVACLIRHVVHIETDRLVRREQPEHVRLAPAEPVALQAPNPR